MHKQDVLNHFGRQRLIADSLRISQAAVSRWGEIIPEKQALRLEYLTQGALTYDPTLYKKILQPEPVVNV